MPDPITAALGIGGSLISGMMGQSAAESAAEAEAAGLDKASQAQLKASQEALGEQRRQYDLTRGDLLNERDRQREFAEPYQAAGRESIAGLQGLLNGTTDPTERLKATPGYQFQMDEGTKAIERSAAARGSLQSGQTMKALNEYGQGVASGAYRGYLTDLFQMAGYGANMAQAGSAVTSQLASTGANTANNLSNIYSSTGSQQAAMQQGIGQARASAYANSPWAGIAGGATKAAVSYGMYNQLGSSPAAGAAPGFSFFGG